MKLTMNRILSLLLISCLCCAPQYCSSEITTYSPEVDAATSTPTNTFRVTSKVSVQSSWDELSTAVELLNGYGLVYLEHLHQLNFTENLLFSPLSSFVPTSLPGGLRIIESYKKIAKGSTGRNVTFEMNYERINETARKLDDKETIKKGSRDSGMVKSKVLYDEAVIMDKLNSWTAKRANKKVYPVYKPAKSNGTDIQLNSLFFKGSWVEPFTEESDPGTFRNIDGSTSKATMISIHNKRFNYLNDAQHKVKIIELPYEGNFSLIVAMPMEPKTFARLVSLADPTGTSLLEELIVSMRPTTLGTVSIPKFHFLLDHHLNPRTVQKATFEVDVDSSISGTLTFGNIPTSRFLFPVDDLIVNLPFIFMVKDNTNGLNVLIGQLNKLTNIYGPGTQ